MRAALLLLPLVVILGCSRNQPPVSTRTLTKSYHVRIAVAKVPDDFLGRFGGSFDAKAGYSSSGSFEGQTQFAAYLMSHTNEFSMASASGDFHPADVARDPTHLSPTIMIALDPQQEARDLDKLGMKVTRASASLQLISEDGCGHVSGSVPFSFMVHLSKPVGNSTDRGGGGFSPAYWYTVGTPAVTPLYQLNGTTLWALAQLDDTEISASETNAASVR
jgi:hypothetical protein